MISGKEIKYCVPGLYKIVWKNGEAAIGIIGELHDSWQASGNQELFDNTDAIDHVELLEPHKPKKIIGQAIKECDLGLYRVYWQSGGSSLAAVGNHHDGVRWLACCNWTSEASKNPTGKIDNNMLESIESMELLQGMPPWRLIDEQA